MTAQKKNSAKTFIFFVIKRNPAAVKQYVCFICSYERGYVQKLAEFDRSHTQGPGHKEPYSPVHWYADIPVHAHMHKQKQAP